MMMLDRPLPKKVETPMYVMDVGMIKDVRAVHDEKVEVSSLLMLVGMTMLLI